MKREVELTDVPRCPSCGSGERTLLYEGREHEYDDTTDQTFAFHACRGCDLLYLDPRPAESALPVIYPPTYYSQTEANASPDTLDLASTTGRLVHSRVIARVMGNVAPFLQLGPSHAFLDVGCGGGRVLRSVQVHTGCAAFGIDMDLSPEVAARFRRPPLVLERGEFLRHDFGERRFDVIYASHLIEHLPNPLDFIAKCEKLLTPGGICVLETPNSECFGRRWFGAAWGANHFPRHWFLLGPRSVRVAVERATDGRMEVAAIRGGASSFFWIWTMHALLVERGWKRLGDALFPSDHRIAVMSHLGLARHATFLALDGAMTRMTGASSSMAVVIRRRSVGLT